jgi:Novel STAND NTPase 1
VTAPAVDVAGPGVAEADLARCPFPGLPYFTEANRRYFVGRERDVELLTANLFAAPLTILYGASGVGKTSVLLAGVVPRVGAEPGAVIVVHRSWQGAEFASALGARLIDAVAARGGDTAGIDAARPLDEILAALAERWDGPLFVVCDQFEEYFLYAPPDPSPTSFDAAFARAVNRRDLDVNFILSLREDSLSASTGSVSGSRASSTTSIASSR